MPIILVRSSNANTIALMVEIHQKSFKGFFLTFLGSKFLAVLYQSIIYDPTGITFIAWEDHQMAGFVVGSTQPSSLYTRLLRNHWWQYGWAVLPALLRKPTIWFRLQRAFSMPKRALPTANCGTLMSIAVSPQFQRQGIGKKLVHAFLDEALCHGLDGVSLTTDAERNDATNWFYTSLGFSLTEAYTTPEGRKMNEYLFHFKGKKVTE